MMNDRHGSARSLDSPALNAFFRVLDRLLIRTVRYRDALHTDLEPCRIHHDEHVFEAAIFFADQRADCACPSLALVVAEDQDAGGTSLDAELMLDRRTIDIVPLAELAVGVKQELRDDEERDPQIGRAH